MRRRPSTWLTWRDDGAPAAAVFNEGAVFLDETDGTPLPGFADGWCRDGILRVCTRGDPPRDLRSRILDFVMGPENDHPIEVQLYSMNLRRNAGERVAAHLRRAGAQDAP